MVTYKKMGKAWRFEKRSNNSPVQTYASLGLNWSNSKKNLYQESFKGTFEGEQKKEFDLKPEYNNLVRLHLNDNG